MERIELSAESEEDYLEYRVIHDDGSEGSASLRLSQLDATHYMAYHLKVEALPVGSTIAELFLYPHSETSLRRTGVASRVLDHVLRDAGERGIKVVTGEITNEEIRKFCQAKGFRGNYSPHCYLLI